MSKHYTPTQRSYVHTKCEGTTIISGDMFTLICDPTQTVSGTFCATCNDLFALDQFVWEDTSERIDHARERWLSEAPAFIKGIQSTVWIVVAIVLGAPLGAGIGWLSGGGQLSHVLIGASVGAIALAGTWISLIPQIVRHVFGWDWRRMT